MRTLRTGKPGFTIVELIVVVIVIGVLLTMIAPRLAGAAGTTRLRAEARRLQAAAQYAGDYAVTHRRACRLVIDADAGRYAILAQDDPVRRPDQFSPLQTGVARPVTLDESLQFARVRVERRPGPDGLQPEGEWIRFEPTGEADAAVVEISNGRMRYSILIFPSTGRVRLVEGVARHLPNDREDLDV